jgi:Peptidase M15
MFISSAKRRSAFRRAACAAIAAGAIALTATSISEPAAAGSFAFAPSPKKQIAVHDFGEEHAFLADSVYGKMNPLILAALPRGKSAIVFNAPTKCVPGSLIKVLKRISATFRSTSKNRKVGGRGKSMHLSCRAVDFRVHGASRGLIQFLQAQSEVGGFNRYPSGFYHIDNGPKRTW